ncbi:ABC transporter permease [Aeromicrobium sp. UC242_57]|uniref:ABC transporter permease n=1 Tax=Aeromicrobium sp. UC242_57 TaxID=3374624 RepID=UPI0037B3273D
MLANGPVHDFISHSKLGSVEVRTPDGALLQPALAALGAQVDHEDGALVVRGVTAEQVGDAAHAGGGHGFTSWRPGRRRSKRPSSKRPGCPRSSGRCRMIDALRYEYVRLRTIRSTYWLLGMAMTFQIVLSVLLAIVIARSDSFSEVPFEIIATIGASTGVAPLFIAYIIGMIGVFTFGHEYRHGMIRATLTAVPNRTHVFVAKMLSTVVVSTLASLACILIALLSLVAFGLDLPTIDEFVNMTIGTTLFTVLFALSGLAFAAITRNQTAAVALLLLVPSLVETIIRAIVIAIKGASENPGEDGGVISILKFLPYDAGGQLYTRASLDDLLSFFGFTPFGPVGGGIVMAVFVGALLLIGYILFRRRDA